MAYTVKQLSELSSVTVRTLHYYEEANLLKPAYYGANGYRYYEEKELLLLQQILFFKELGFSIKQIQKVLGRSDFDQLAALQSHKVALTKESEKIDQLLKTIDKTISHVKGKKKMKDKEIFGGLGTLVEKGKGNESYFTAEELVLKSVKNLTTETPEKVFCEKIAKESNTLYRKIAKCLEEGKKTTSAEVQALVKKHHAFIAEYQTATKEVYKALAQLYHEHPDFRQQLNSIHPDLAPFIAKAMIVFADQELE